MGDTFQTIADLDAGPRDAPLLGARVVEWLVAEGIVRAEAEVGWGLSPLPAHPPGPDWRKAVADPRWGSPDGVAVHTARHVFHSIGVPGPYVVTCPRCGQASPAGGDLTARLGSGMERWLATGDVDVDCPACAAAVPLPDWTWTEDVFALAHLGFEFWGWPALSEEFRARLTRFLEGHRTAFLTGKI
ncbi:hypothetical protein ACWC10_18215 [Streptomyces sp. NPDC001595]|uniref:hypothetical protein n=1 Tax=Streptomyces sp. NPDC001532 TaxID=3154520 RepID=UPI00332098C0